MRIKINIFDNAERAQRLKDLKGDTASIYFCDGGAKIYDFADYGFVGESDLEVWIVVVTEE